MPYYYGFDTTYVIFVLPAILLALLAQVSMQSAYAKYSKILSRRGVTGAEAARMILEGHKLGDIRVELSPRGGLSDHYDPRERVIRLSEQVYGGSSIAALGIAAHEAGHSIQHSVGYIPLKLRSAVIPATQIGSVLAWPLVLLGLILSYGPLITVGIAAFGLAVVFQLITLPVEFDASRRALGILQRSGYLGREELAGAKKVLTAAAMTYVAALAVSLANLLRIISIAGRRRR